MSTRVMRAITRWKAYSRVLAPRRKPGRKLRRSSSKSSSVHGEEAPDEQHHPSRARLPRISIHCEEGGWLRYMKPVARDWVFTERSGFERLIERDESAAHNQAGPQNQGERCCQLRL